ncbi:MAG: capsular biosynthesis protein [Dinoroseobacter sp.]|nr:capsular biosynthesis protein [Dinoroseobacter sp.]
MTKLRHFLRPEHQRVFVFLQGPHGPFFGELGQRLEETGARVVRIGFNAGDARFWPNPETYIPFKETPDEWSRQLPGILEALNATDLVLYGDVRPIHASALRCAQQMGLRTHLFEEGYLRPSWITYERSGTNGHSELMRLSLPDIQAALGNPAQDMSVAPATWGEMRQHIWHGARYQFHVMLRNQRYPGFTPHRALNVRQEFALYAKKLASMPVNAMRRTIATRRVKAGGFPYHLFLLQLEHDTSFTAHCDYESFADVVEETVSAFAQYAPRHHHLVFKAHPLEDGRAGIPRKLAQLGAHFGVTDRLHYVAGGKLAPLLDPARSVVTVNSTAAQQALWRGLPVKALGRAIYNKPQLTSPQSLDEFFQRPLAPDPAAYRDFRHFLLQTSQVRGGFYAAHGRCQLFRELLDLMLAETCPYSKFYGEKPLKEPRFNVVGR